MALTQQQSRDSCIFSAEHGSTLEASSTMVHGCHSFPEDIHRQEPDTPPSPERSCGASEGGPQKNPCPNKAPKRKYKKGKYRGVRERGQGRWVAEVKDSVTGRRKWLGTFSTPEAAALAFDEAVREIRGSGAKTNFPPGSRLSEASASVVVTTKDVEIPPRFGHVAGPKASPMPQSLQSVLTSANNGRVLSVASRLQAVTDWKIASPGPKPDSLAQLVSSLAEPQQPQEAPFLPYSPRFQEQQQQVQSKREPVVHHPANSCCLHSGTHLIGPAAVAGGMKALVGVPENNMLSAATVDEGAGGDSVPMDLVPEINGQIEPKPEIGISAAGTTSQGTRDSAGTTLQDVLGLAARNLGDASPTQATGTWATPWPAPAGPGGVAEAQQMNTGLEGDAPPSRAESMNCDNFTPGDACQETTSALAEKVGKLNPPLRQGSSNMESLLPQEQPAVAPAVTGDPSKTQGRRLAVALDRTLDSFDRTFGSLYAAELSGFLGQSEAPGMDGSTTDPLSLPGRMTVRQSPLSGGHIKRDNFAALPMTDLGVFIQRSNARSVSGMLRELEADAAAPHDLSLDVIEGLLMD